MTALQNGAFFPRSELKGHGATFHDRLSHQSRGNRQCGRIWMPAAGIVSRSPMQVSVVRQKVAVEFDRELHQPGIAELDGVDFPL